MTAFYNTQHSPVGAFASFTLGCRGPSGGMALEAGEPARQNVYIGCDAVQGDDIRLFPFANLDDQEERRRYVVDDHSEILSTGGLSFFADDAIRRDLGYASDRWLAEDLGLTLYTPRRALPDAEDPHCDVESLKQAVLPAVFGELTLDNRQGTKPRRAFFGLGANPSDPRMRELYGPLSDGLAGFALGREMMVCGRADDWESRQYFSIWDIGGRQGAAYGHCGLGSTGLIQFTVGPGQCETRRFVLVFYKEGPVTTGMEGRYFYTRFFDRIESAGLFALESASGAIAVASQQDQELHEANLTGDQQWMLSQAVHSYYGSTEFLDIEGRPLWIVNEGEYRMINTLDLSIDQAFFELEQNPWTLRNLCDWYLDRYAYRDQIRDPHSGDLFPGGLAFTHDMGVANQFSRPGFSSYERPGLTGCFSYMTTEELCNWTLLACLYGLRSGDAGWLGSRREALRECLQSLLQRDHPDPARRDGVIAFESSRTDDGAEITTYDSLDRSLGQSRKNTYTTVRVWACALALKAAFQSLEDHGNAQACHACALRIAGNLLKWRTPEARLPALLETGSSAFIIPVVEGLVYPYALGLHSDLAPEGPFAPLLQAFRQHLESVLQPGACLFDDGAWKLSSTSINTWLSKIYLNQFVARQVLGLSGPALRDIPDAVHRAWLQSPDNAFWAWSDQSHAGHFKGSRYYPRGVTAILWLQENASRDAP